MDEREVRWLVLFGIAVAIAAAAGHACVESGRSATDRAAMEHGYVQRRVGNDLLWVKE